MHTFAHGIENLIILMFASTMPNRKKEYRNEMPSFIRSENVQNQWSVLIFYFILFLWMHLRRADPERKSGRQLLPDKDNSNYPDHSNAMLHIIEQEARWAATEGEAHPGWLSVALKKRWMTLKFRDLSKKNANTPLSMVGTGTVTAQSHVALIPLLRQPNSTHGNVLWKSSWAPVHCTHTLLAGWLRVARWNVFNVQERRSAMTKYPQIRIQSRMHLPPPPHYPVVEDVCACAPCVQYP